MNPQYIIDGYNMIYHVPKFLSALEHSLELGRNSLIHFIRGYQSSKKFQVTIVFDGDKVGYFDSPASSTKWLQIIYSQPPEKADPLIKRLIQNAQHKKNLILVTSDQELVQFAKNMGAQILTPDEFYHRATKPAQQEQLDQKYDSQVSSAEIAEWLKLFGEKTE